MITRPLLSTRFPYTTLFRSLLRESWCEGGINFGYYKWDIDKYKMKQLISIEYRTTHLDNLDEKSFHSLINEYGRVYFSDRKSTRLNSSHVAISYAVFCLKKK